MEVVYKESQVEMISNMLNISKRDVDLVLMNYRNYLQLKINNGETVRVLGICYLVNINEGIDVERETLGYVASEIAIMSGMGSVTVLNILTALEDCIVHDISEGKGYCLKGLIRVRGVINDKGELKVRVLKSVIYNGENIRVSTLNSFRRKVISGVNSVS